MGPDGPTFPPFGFPQQDYEAQQLVEPRSKQIQGAFAAYARSLPNRIRHPKPKTRRLLIRAGIAAVVVVAVLVFIYWLGLQGVYNLPYAMMILPDLGRGFLVTLTVIGVVIPLGFTLGFLFGWARTTRSFLLRGVGSVYVEVFRGLPPIVLIFFSFLITSLTILSVTHNPFIAGNAALWMGAIALALHSGAYQTEIIRAGILSVPTGQMEAADSIGMGKWQAMFRVTLPQAFRVSLPALGNEFASVIKDTSLLNVIGWLDLAQIGLLQVPRALMINFDLVFIIWMEIAALYFVLTFIVTNGVRFIENRYKVPGLEAAEL